MKSQLLLLTKTYPFASGEGILESEIGYLADSFDEVLILAVEVEQVAEPTESLPVNVKAYAAEPPSGNNLKVACGSCVDIAVDELRPFMSDYDTDALRRSPSRWTYFREYAARVVAIRDAIAKLVEEGELQPASVFYSYWLLDTATAALMARELPGFKATPVVSQAHGLDLHGDISKTDYLPLRPWILEQITQVYPDSESGAEFAQALRGLL